MFEYFRKKTPPPAAIHPRIVIDVHPEGLEVTFHLPDELFKLPREQLYDHAVNLASTIFTYSSGDGRSLAQMQQSLSYQCGVIQQQGFASFVLTLLSKASTISALEREKPVVPASQVFRSPAASEE